MREKMVLQRLGTREGGWVILQTGHEQEWDNEKMERNANNPTGTV